MLVRRAAIAAALSVAILAAAPGSAEAARGPERAFTQMINDTRSTALLGSLKLNDHLSDVARKHSKRMASQGELYHSDLERLLGPRITAVGENVGYGGSLDQLLQAFMASPPHAANILGTYTRTGVGVVRVDGQLWITQVFAA
jgi:uncharacterized protein YkwD